MSFAKFLRTPFLQNASGRLLLNITATINQLKICLGFVLYKVLLQQVTLDIKSQYKAIALHHEKTITKFRKQQTKTEDHIKPSLPKSTVHTLRLGRNSAENVRFHRFPQQEISR